MKKLLLFIALIIITVFVYKEVSMFLQIDTCLDSGGSFDYSSNECIK